MPKLYLRLAAAIFCAATIIPAAMAESPAEKSIRENARDVKKDVSHDAHDVDKGATHSADEIDKGAVHADKERPRVTSTSIKS